MFGGLFKRKPSDEEKTEKIFGKLIAFLSDDTRQNASYPDDVRAVFEAGPAVDQIPGATGEFGRDPHNPIPVNGPLGEVLYLSSLRSANGQFLFAHRLGSYRQIDIFETVTADGAKWDFLYFSLYHPRKSRRAPTGYSFRPSSAPPFVYATNIFVPDFPHNMRQAVSEWMNGVLNVPMVAPEIRMAIESGRFSRPAAHAARLETLELEGKTYAAPRSKVPQFLEHVETQAATVAAVLEKGIQCAPFDFIEVLFFCAATLRYAYEHYGTGGPDRRLMEEFQSAVAANCAKQSISFGEALTRYRSRHSEYAALYDTLFEEGKDNEHQRHWLVTIMMHLVERATGRSAQGYMVNIYSNADVVAAFFDDSFQLVQK